MLAIKGVRLCSTWGDYAESGCIEQAAVLTSASSLGSSMTTISLIVAMDENGLIGKDNALPWQLPGDLAFFKRTTMGKPILMGRKTWDSLGRPLPGRDNVVITRQEGFAVDGAIVFGSLTAAIDAYTNVPEIVVIGGAQIYVQALERVDRMYVTRVHAELQGDAWFPDVDWNAWSRSASELQAADEKNAYAYSFECWERA